MTETSARFALPYLQPGQAQKEAFHNEALAAIDAALHPAAEAMGLNTPPASPIPGQCWIVGTAPTGAWTGKAKALAAWTAGGWRFVTPAAGMLVWHALNGIWAWYDGDTWTENHLPVAAIRIEGEQVIGPQLAAVAAPTGGAVIDVQARDAIMAIKERMENHGLIAT